jgi:F-type H+-transporting ATPase subunit delta
MRSVTAIILHACITLAVAEELAANHNGIEQNLFDRAMSTPIHDANLDATTFAKTHAGTNVRPLATMNRAVLPVNPGRAGFKWAGAPINRQALGRVAATQKEAAVSTRYGQGLFELSDEKGEIDANKKVLDSLKLTWEEVPELKGALTNPTTPLKDKKAIIDKMLDSGTVKTFCNYLVDKSRMNIFPEIIAAFDVRYNAQSAITVCEVTSACKLSEDQLFNIAQSVQRQTGAKSVKIQEKVDQSLIGGFKLEFGGKQVDLSIRAGLEGMRAQFGLNDPPLYKD